MILAEMTLPKVFMLFGLTSINIVAFANGNFNNLSINALTKAEHFQPENINQQGIQPILNVDNLNISDKQNNSTKVSKKRHVGNDFDGYEEENENLYDARGALPMVSDQPAIESRRGSLFRNIFQKPGRKPDLSKLKRPNNKYDKQRVVYQAPFQIYELRRAADMESSATTNQMVTQNRDIKMNVPFSVHPSVSSSLKSSSENDVVFLKNWHDQFGTLFSSEAFAQKNHQAEDNLITFSKDKNTKENFKMSPKKNRDFEVNESSLDFNFNNFTSLHDMVTDHYKHGKPNKDFGEKSMIDMDEEVTGASNSFIHEYIGNETNHQARVQDIKIVGKPVIKDFYNKNPLKSEVAHSRAKAASPIAYNDISLSADATTVTSDFDLYSKTYMQKNKPQYHAYPEQSKKAVNYIAAIGTPSKNDEHSFNFNRNYLNFEQTPYLAADMSPNLIPVAPYVQGPAALHQPADLAIQPASQHLSPTKNRFTSYPKPPWKSENYDNQPDHSAQNVMKNGYFGHLPPLLSNGYPPYVATNLVKDRIMYPRYSYSPVYLSDEYASPLRRFGTELKREREASEYLAISGVALVGALVGYFLLNTAGPLFGSREQENPMKVVVKGAREGLSKLVVALDEYEVNLDNHEIGNSTSEKHLGKEEQLQLQEQYNLKLEENHQNLTRIFNDFFIKMTEALKTNGFGKVEEDQTYYSDILNNVYEGKMPNHSMELLVEAVLKDLVKKMAIEELENQNVKSSKNEAPLNNLLQVSTSGMNSGEEQIKSEIHTENLVNSIYNSDFIEKLMLHKSNLDVPLTTPKNVVLIKELKFIDEDTVSDEEFNSGVRNQKKIKDAHNNIINLTAGRSENRRQPPLRVVGNTLYKRINSNIPEPPKVSHSIKNVRFLQDDPNTSSRNADFNSLNFQKEIKFYESSSPFVDERVPESKLLLSSKEVNEIKSQIKKIIINNEEQFVKKMSPTDDNRARQLTNVFQNKPKKLGLLNKGVIIKNEIHIPAVDM